MVTYTFKKEERLCNKRLLTGLYKSGSSFLLYPYKVVFLCHEPLPAPAQVVISVPKRRFKKAVDRNLLKRRMREAYRLQKDNLFYPFLTDKQVQLLLSVQYIGTELLDYDILHQKMGKLFVKLQGELTKML